MTELLLVKPESLEESWDSLCRTIQKREEMHAALRAENKALRADKERLDWMDQNPEGIARSKGFLGSADAWIVRHENGYFDTAIDLRSAIDAAMQGKKETR